eukprot:3162117-Pyramimonas_sp.AAC.4
MKSLNNGRGRCIHTYSRARVLTAAVLTRWCSEVTSGHRSLPVRTRCGGRQDCVAISVARTRKITALCTHTCVHGRLTGGA